MCSVWHKIVAVCGLVVLLASCNSDGACRQERYVAMGVNLYHCVFDNNLETLVSEPYTPDSLTVYGVDNDSLLYNNSKVHKIELPLRKSHNVSRFVFVTDGVYDTLTVVHNNTNNYLSMECGCIVFADIREVIPTNFKIDSAIIRKPEVINVSEVHVDVYFKSE